MIEGTPLQRRNSPEYNQQSEVSKGSRSPSASTRDLGLAPYTSPVEYDGQYPPDLPAQPVEIPLEEGRFRISHRHF